MVAGVFTARWTFPTLLKGTTYVFADLLDKKHLIVWAILAGALWAVANTLTVFAIRDVGLATAFPALEHELTDRPALGAAALQRAAGCGCQEHGKGGRWGSADRHLGDHAGLQHDSLGR